MSFAQTVKRLANSLLDLGGAYPMRFICAFARGKTAVSAKSNNLWSRLLDPLTIDLSDELTVELTAYYLKFRWYYPHSEPASKAWCAKNLKKDWVILDCGAHLGYYSLLFSWYGGHVHAFEPTSTYDLLTENLANHPWADNVTCHRLAAGATSGQKEESLHQVWGTAPVKNAFTFTTIDDFVRDNKLAKLDFVKIDVDGFDYQVLLGMKDVMADLRPIIMVELCPLVLAKRGLKLSQVLSLIEERDYKVVTVLDTEQNHICFPEEISE